MKPRAQLLLKLLKLPWCFVVVLFCLVLFLIMVNVVSDSKILNTFQSANYVCFLTKKFRAGSFAYELLSQQG